MKKWVRIVCYMSLIVSVVQAFYMMFAGLFWTNVTSVLVGLVWSLVLFLYALRKGKDEKARKKAEEIDVYEDDCEEDEY